MVVQSVCEAGTHKVSQPPSQSERSKGSQSDGCIQSQSVGQIIETDGDEEIKVGELDGPAVQMAVETDPSPS